MAPGKWGESVGENAALEDVIRIIVLCMGGMVVQNKLIV
jgi:hypothetical protein